CGLCLAECPTYRLSADENESPRGRLAMIEALVDGQLEARSVLHHLDTCLVCRRCERICPSGVPYGTIIDQARAITHQQGEPTWRRLLRNPRVQGFGTSLAQRSPMALSRPLSALHHLHRMARALGPATAAPRPGFYAAGPGDRRGHVGLFTGCATRVQQGSALRAAITLLRSTGYDVTVPSPVCCGAMHAHAGDTNGAAVQAAASREAFPAGLDAIVSIASGCGVQVDDFHPPLPAPHHDICAFLVESGALDASAFVPVAEPIALHVPCTVENVYRGGAWARQLVELLQPDSFHVLESPGQCCGAAGDYLLRHPATADALRAPLIAHLEQRRPRYLLTSNIGCAMHLAIGLADSLPGCTVLHPVELLADRLAITATADDGRPLD
ncbi:MAG: (Fe-S)-binding protein, partial [Gammaproteobacteria bacterium]|nr:(Fe-S)-binding protein [Gammaproteobacteria bacterium]